MVGGMGLWGTPPTCPLLAPRLYLSLYNAYLSHLPLAEQRCLVCSRRQLYAHISYTCAFPFPGLRVGNRLIQRIGGESREVEGRNHKTLKYKRNFGILDSRLDSRVGMMVRRNRARNRVKENHILVYFASVRVEQALCFCMRYPIPQN